MMNPEPMHKTVFVILLMFFAGCYTVREVQNPETAGLQDEKPDTASCELQSVILADGGRVIFKKKPLLTDSLLDPGEEYEIRYTPYRCLVTEVKTFIHADNRNRIRRIERADGQVILFPAEDGWIPDSILTASEAVLLRKTPIQRKDIRGYFYKQFDMEATVKLVTFFPSVAIFAAAVVGIAILGGYLAFASGGKIF